MNIRQILRVGALVLVAAFAASASSGEPAERPQRVIPNFQNVDVSVLADAVSKVTGKVIAVDPEARRPVDLVSQKALTTSEFYQMFVQAVTDKGLQVVEADGKVTVSSKTPVKAGSKDDGVVTLK